MSVFAKLRKPDTGWHALYVAVLGSACMFSIQGFSLQSSPLAVLRRLACAPDKNAGVKRPGYEANNFRVPCRRSAV